MQLLWKVLHCFHGHIYVCCENEIDCMNLNDTSLILGIIVEQVN